MLKKVAILTVVFSVSAPALAWLGPGHELATRTALVAASKDLPAFFRQGADLAAHCSRDPDLFTKPIAAPELHATEAPDHYFDIELVQDMKLPGDRYQFLEILCQRKLKPSQVGMLPYAVMEWTERLAVALAEHRKWPNDPLIQQKCLVYAGLLAHYGADLCMPLHTTIHYDGRTKIGEKSPRTGIHLKVDALVQKSGLTAEQAAENLQPKPLDSLLPGILGRFAESHALVNSAYELEKALPDAEKPIAESDKAVRDFSRSRLKAAAEFIASLYLTAWRDSEKIKLPDWHQRPENK